MFKVGDRVRWFTHKLNEQIGIVIACDNDSVLVDFDGDACWYANELIRLRVPYSIIKFKK